jgi:hypothetical protein
MNKLILAKNRKVEFPKRIKLTEPNTLDNCIYDLEFDPGLITEPGTNIDADLINLLQKNTVFDLMCEYVENTEVNSNLKIEIEGINEFSVFQGMKIILLMKTDSSFEKPLQLMFIDGDVENGKYPLKIYNNGVLETINNMPVGIYQLIFIDDSFIVISSGAEKEKTQNTREILWQGRKNIANGDFVNCTLENILPPVASENYILIINITHTNGLNVDFMIPSAGLLFEGFNISIPNIVQNQIAFILATVKRSNNNLILSGTKYTVLPSLYTLNKVTLIK